MKHILPALAAAALLLVFYTDWAKALLSSIALAALVAVGLVAVVLVAVVLVAVVLVRVLKKSNT